MNRREFAKKVLGLGTTFTAGAIALPMEVKSQILKPMIDGYCSSYWDAKLYDGINNIKSDAPSCLIGDTHLHSVHSDGKYTIPEILTRAANLELDFLVLTEHITPEYFDVECPLSSILDQVETVKRLKDRGLQPPEIYPSVEISSSEGHIIAIFPKTYLSRKDFYTEFRSIFAVCGDKYMDSTWVISNIKRLGGKVIVPHPGEKRRDMPFGIPVQSLGTHLEGQVDGVEDLNTGNGCFGRFSEKFGLASMGASDDHFKALIGTSVTSYNGAEYNDLTEAITKRATKGVQTAHVFQPLLKASLFYYTLRV